MPGRPRRGRSAGRCARDASGGIPGPSSSTISATRSPRALGPQAHGRAGGGVDERVAGQARAICCTRSSSASAQASSSARPRGWPDASASAPRSSADDRTTSRQARPPRARSGSGRRPSARGRAGRWRAWSAGRPAPASSRGTRGACSRRGPRPRAARGSPRARTAASGARGRRWRRTPSGRWSSCASWIRIRSNEAASWPTSSAPPSTTGSSKAPSAIRSAARWRRPSRRAWIAATASPRTSAINRAATVAYRSLRLTSSTVAS